MAISTCSKCGGRSFELALFTPIGESKKVTLVQMFGRGAHNHRTALLRESRPLARQDNIRRSVWVPAFAGTTSG